jgi:hypothetical protein
MNPNYRKLKELASSLVDDIDQVIQTLEGGDHTLHDMDRRLKNSEEKEKEFLARCEEHKALADKHASEVVDLKARLKLADMQERTQKGHASSFDFKARQAGRIAREVAQRMAARREMLLRKEIDRRVNAIGKKIVANSGAKRKGGGFDLIEDDGLLPGGRKNPNSIINNVTKE